MSCIMKECPNSRHACKHLNFFKLPPTDEKRKQWLEVCEAESTLTKFPVVCADHFLPSQLYLKGSRVRLLSDAVPRPMNANAEQSARRTLTKLDFRQKKLKKELPITELHTRQKKSKKELPITELNVRQKKSKIEAPEFELEPDDDYDVRCGEVFVTYGGVLVFHCSPCNKRYGTFFNFLKHLTTEHYKYISEDPDHNECETAKIKRIKKLISVDNNSICEENHEIKQEDDENEDLQEFMKIEVEPTMVQVAGDPFSAIEQILIEETPHCNETDLEYEDLNGEEKTVDTSHAFDNNDRLEDQKQSLSEAEDSPKSKKSADYIFKCDICSKIFKNIRILRRHARNVHSTEGKYKCDVCGLDLKHYSYLKNHMLRHTGEKNISCDICSKKFYTNSEHKLHLRSHTGERPFVCSSCGLAFTNSGALTVHEKIHNIPPLFRCNYCDRGFYSQYKMKVHMIVHSKERPFVCPVCSASFPRKRSMLRHIDLRHKKSSLSPKDK